MKLSKELGIEFGKDLDLGILKIGKAISITKKEVKEFNREIRKLGSQIETNLSDKEVSLDINANTDKLKKDIEKLNVSELLKFDNLRGSGLFGDYLANLSTSQFSNIRGQTGPFGQMFLDGVEGINGNSNTSFFDSSLISEDLAILANGASSNTTERSSGRARRRQKPPINISQEVGKLVKGVFGSLTGELETLIKTGSFDVNSFLVSAGTTAVKIFENVGNKLLDNVVKSIGSSGFGGGGGGLGNIFGSVFGGLFGRAYGGPVSGGQSYIVGENGPELFLPSQSGQILTNTDTAGLLRQGDAPGQNIVFNVNAVDSKSFGDMLRDPKSQQMISNFAVSAVQKQSNRSLNRSPFE